MADLSIYELEDIVWDDFEHSSDHIVPHPTEEQVSKDKCEGKSCKKPWLDLTPLQHNKGNPNASSSICQFKVERESKTLNRETDMMEKDPWSHVPDGVFSASGDADSAKDVLSVQSGDTKLSNYSSKNSNMNSNSELCTDEGMLIDTFGAVDRSSCNDLNLFSNDGDDKEPSDLLYFGWPDIGNFEDMDRILSKCDSPFGLRITGNDDELVWLTSEDPGGGYEESLKMDFKFPCSEPRALTNVSEDHEPQESYKKASSFVSDSKAELSLKDQKEQSRQENQTEGTKAGHYLKFYGLKSNDIQISANATSDRPFTPIGNWQKAKYLGPGSVGYMKGSSYLHLGHGHVPVQSICGSIMTCITSESKAESRAHSMKNSSQPSFHGNHNHSGMMLEASRNNLVPSQKKIQMLKNKIEYQSYMEGFKRGASAELDSFDVPEGTSVSSELDEISPEAITFRQLQQVMLQLDERTKLCIRNSLYRLARNAEQRHNYAGISDSTANCGAIGRPLMTEQTSKYTGLVDMETDTNPIDRTIAHLLFHRPSNSSNTPITLPLKQNTRFKDR